MIEMTDDYTPAMSQYKVGRCILLCISCITVPMCSDY